MRGGIVIAVRVRVEQTALPGVGVRHDLITEAGRRIGVITHRTGQRDLVLYAEDDPDASIADIPLTTDEAIALADLLGNPLVLGQLSSVEGGRRAAHRTDHHLRRLAVRRPDARRHPRPHPHRRLDRRRDP